MLLSRFRGALLAFAIGDALGSPYEGFDAKKVKKVWGKGRPEITDDTQLMLSTCESIVECGEVDLFDIARRMVILSDRGILKRLGKRTRYAIKNLKKGVSPLKSGATGDWAAGSGGAMKILGVAFFMHKCSSKELMSEVKKAVIVTHNNIDAIEGAYVVARIISQLLEKSDINFVSVCNILSEITSEKLKEEIKKRLYILDDDKLSYKILPSIGTMPDIYSVLGNSIYCFLKYKPSFSKIIESAILAGGDTDTTAAIAGSFWGALYGNICIPVEYIGKLGSLSEYIIKIADKLYERSLEKCE